jgi:hypothetical protein
MKHNPLAQILDRAMEERRYHDLSVAVDRRAKVPHFRHADIEKTVRQLNLGEQG